MFALDDSCKKKLVSQIIDIKRELTWIAQGKKESESDFGGRVTELLVQYINKSNLAKIELHELTDSIEEKEKLALYVFVKGLRKDIKRYMSDISLYANLWEARIHAQSIGDRLREIKKLKSEMLNTIDF